MKIELINIGSELLLGLRDNSHFQWIGKELAKSDFSLNKQSSIPDEETIISQTLLSALPNNNVVIITGGLGPTSDDITCEAVGKALDLDFIEDKKIITWISDFLQERGREELLAGQRKQARIPCGSEALRNFYGTAPAIYFPPRLSKANCALFLLPGPTHEMRPLFLEEVLPRIKSLSSPCPKKQKSLSLKFSQLREPDFASVIEPILKKYPDLKYGFYPGIGELEFYLRGESSIVEKIAKIASENFSQYLFSSKGENLAKIIVDLYQQKKWQIALAESCTGGGLSKAITNIAGASAILDRSWIVYSNQAKIDLLSVSPETLQKHGAVSEETARELSQACLKHSQAQISLAITGIAGPQGSEGKHPIGTVFFSLSTKKETFTYKENFGSFPRKVIQQKAIMKALDILRLFVV